MRLQTFASAVLGVGCSIAFSTTDAQSAMPVRELAAVEAHSTDHFGAILGLRAVSGGGVFVNDGKYRQLVLLDAKLGNRTVVIDSVSAGGQSYGPRATSLLPYLGDSAMFVDISSLSLLVLGPTGTVVRVMAAPKPGDVRFLSVGTGGVDAKGNIVYRAINPPPRSATGGIGMAVPQDSSPIVRASFESRLVDTLGRIKIANGQRVATVTTNGKTETTIFTNPISNIDDWAVLADGSVAFVRGYDYHVDVLRPDGAIVKGAKLPFDWKRLSDADKQGLIDSARTAREKAQEAAKARAAAGGGAGGGRGTVAGGAVLRSPTGEGPAANTNFSPVKNEFVPISEIVDYWPPIRTGASKADADGNLWILPTTSAQSNNGELVYDVVSNRGAFMHRVRVPSGRSIAGFGKNGVVYLMYKDGEAGWLLEKTRVVATTKSGGGL